MSKIRIAFSRPLAGIGPEVAPDLPSFPEENEEFVPLLDPLADRAVEEEGARRAIVSLSDQIRLTLEQVPSLVSSRLEELSVYAIELGLGLAQTVLGAEVEQGRYNPAAAVQESLESAISGMHQGAIQVLLNPADLSLVLSSLEEMGSIEAQSPEVRFEVDQNLPRGACRIETSVGRILHDPTVVIETAMTRIRDEAKQ